MATKIPLLSAFASGYGATAPKRSEGGTDLREALRHRAIGDAESGLVLLSLEFA